MTKTSPKTSSRPLPWNHLDYREYLRKMVVFLKATRPSFSYRQFSRRAGFASPNYLKLVTDGKRNLAVKAIPQFSMALRLSDVETEYLQELVLFAHSKTDHQKNLHYQRLRQKQGDKPLIGFAKAQYDIYTNWYILPIRELIGMEDFREDAHWIAHRLHPSIRPHQAESALKLLEKVGLAERDEHGTLRQAERNLATPPTIQLLAVRNYHRSMMEKAITSLDGLPTHQRNLSALTIALSREQYEVLCEKIEEFRHQTLHETHQTTENQELYHVGFQVVPLTRSKK
jgi:uncharacterized protein (TIGR02147 family)